MLINAAGPLVDPTMQLSLVSSRDVEPPVFTLSFNSTQGPPTEVNCTVDGTAVSVPEEDLTRSVVEVNLPSVVEIGVTFRQRLGGMYICTVNLKGVNNNSALFTLASNSSLLSVSGKLLTIA